MRLNNQPEIIAILRNIVEDNSQRLYKEYDIYEQCYMSMCIYIHIYIYIKVPTTYICVYL